jgi:hypothetical protein
VDVLIFYVLVFGLMRFRYGSDKGTASNVAQIPEKVRRRRCRGRKHEPYPESPNSPRPKKARQLKSEVKSMIIIFFDIKGIVHKEILLAGQTISAAYYCNILRRLPENVRRLLPELWRQKKWLLHHDNAPFSPGNF